jgi:apolipoprotein N-acyltransferase
MAFALKSPLRFASVVALSTAALWLLGDGMNPIWPLLWVAPLPVLLFAAESASWRVSGATAALSMLLGSLTMLYYIHFVIRSPVIAWLAPFSIISLLFAIGVLLFRALLRLGAVFGAVIALPALWTVMEYLGSFVPANGTAGSLAYTQLRFLPFLQLASLTGPWGMSFLLLLFPSAIATAFHLRRISPMKAARVLVTVLAILAGTILFGVIRLAAPEPGHKIMVGLLATDRVQIAEPGVDMQNLVRSYAEQAERLARQGARIVVMPEKTGVLLERDARTMDLLLQSVADRTGATLVIGVLHVVAGHSFNEARIYASHQPIVTYDKQHMLPPIESKLTPGASLTVLSKSGDLIGVAICKDMDFIRPALDYGHAAIALLLDPAWDFNVDRTWHGHIAIMRGVENGYAIAHTAKEGFLTVTDDRGRILGEVRSDQAPFASLLINVPLHHDKTVFDRYGAWFPWLAGLMLLAAIVQLATGLLDRSGKRRPDIPGAA